MNREIARAGGVWRGREGAGRPTVVRPVRATVGRSEDGEVAAVAGRSATSSVALSPATLLGTHRLDLFGTTTTMDSSRDYQRAAPSSSTMQPLTHAALAGNQPPSPSRHPSAGLWSVLPATGHSDDGDDDHHHPQPPQLPPQPAPRHRTAREHYFGLNPSPRPSRFRAAVRRVVTDISFRIGERIGRAIGEHVVAARNEAAAESERRGAAAAASHGGPTVSAIPPQGREATRLERSRGRSRRRNSEQERDGRDARARHRQGRHGGPRGHEQTATNYEARRGRSRRRRSPDLRREDRVEPSSGRASRRRRREHRRSTS